MKNSGIQTNLVMLFSDWAVEFTMKGVESCESDGFRGVV